MTNLAETLRNKSNKSLEVILQNKKELIIYEVSKASNNGSFSIITDKLRDKNSNKQLIQWLKENGFKVKRYWDPITCFQGLEISWKS